MSRTIRRKHYTPSWVTQDSREFIDPRFGVVVWAGLVELEGEARSKKLRWWHEDKSSWWGARPPKPFRQDAEMQHRQRARDELVRCMHQQEHEHEIRPEPRLGFWG